MYFYSCSIITVRGIDFHPVHLACTRPLLTPVGSIPLLDTTKLWHGENVTESFSTCPYNDGKSLLSAANMCVCVCVCVCRIDHEMSVLTPALHGSSSVTSSSHVTQSRATHANTGVHVMVNARQLNNNNTVRLTAVCSATA